MPIANSKRQQSVTHHVTVYAHDKLDLYHSAKLLSGLFSLETSGEITLKFQNSTDARSDDALILDTDVFSLAHNERKRVTYDLRDQRDLTGIVETRHCDIYFKRNVDRGSLNHLSTDFLRKIRPFGLNYGCVLPRSRRRLLCLLLKGSLQELTRSPQEVGHVARAKLLMARILRGLPRAMDFELAPDVKTDPLVLFQTRVWDPKDFATSIDDINNNRVCILRALRGHFGGRLIGGLVPTEYALRFFPKEVTRQPTRRTEYARLARRGIIGIYTRGVHDSVAFKLPEYFASSKCIVSEHIQNELPVPIREGTHFLKFGDPDECIAKCEQILSDDALSSKMRFENYDYYTKEIEPVAHVRRLLQTAFASQTHAT